MKSFEYHPASSLFPMLPDPGLQELAEDIQRNGLLEPIVLYEGKILDGRNRFEACRAAGIEPRFVEWSENGASLTCYVLSKNLHRRHLTTGQKAEIAIEAASLLREEARKRQATSGPGIHGGKPLRSISNEGVSNEHGKAREIAARQVGISATTVWEAEQVKKADPEEFERAKRGETTVHAAFRKVKGTPPAGAQRLPKQERIQSISGLAQEGYSAEQIAREFRFGSTGAQHVRRIAREANISMPGDIATKGNRRLDINRIVEKTVNAAEALTAGLELVDGRIEQVDIARLDHWIKSLQLSIGALNGLIRKLRKVKPL